MAGFRSPLFLLGLAAATQQGGFVSPLPVPPISGSSAGQQAGYVSPLPIPPVTANAQQQAGFPGPLFRVRYADNTFVPPEPEEDRIQLRGGGLDQEEEEIIAVIMAATLRRGYGGI